MYAAAYDSAEGWDKLKAEIAALRAELAELKAAAPKKAAKKD